MKTDKNTINLGSEHCPGSQNWFYLILEGEGKWHVDREKDYDVPDREGYVDTVKPEDYPNHLVYDEPLNVVVAKKLSELGISI